MTFDVWKKKKKKVIVNNQTMGKLFYYRIVVLLDESHISPYSCFPHSDVNDNFV